MYKYCLWVRINPLQTVHTYIWADDDLQAKLIGETQYGPGNVLNWTRVD